MLHLNSSQRDRGTRDVASSRRGSLHLNYSSSLEPAARITVQVVRASKESRNSRAISPAADGYRQHPALPRCSSASRLVPALSATGPAVVDEPCFTWCRQRGHCVADRPPHLTRRRVGMPKMSPLAAGASGDHEIRTSLVQPGYADFCGHALSHSLPKNGELIGTMVGMCDEFCAALGRTGDSTGCPRRQLCAGSSAAGPRSCPAEAQHP